MTKIEILGPRELLMPVLARIRELGILQVEAETTTTIDADTRPHLKSLLIDREALGEKLYLEDLRQRIGELLNCLPEQPVRKIYLSPEHSLEAARKLIDGHLGSCREYHRKGAAARKELIEIDKFAAFLDQIAPLVPGLRTDSDLDFIGIELKDQSALPPLHQLLHRITAGQFEIQTLQRKDKRLVGLIATEKDHSDPIKQALRGEALPELTIPAEIDRLPFAEKLPAVDRRTGELKAIIETSDRELMRWAGRWLPFYRMVVSLIDERLSLLRQSAAVLETEMCFYLLGWVPTSRLDQLRRDLGKNFGGRVVLEEKELLEQDLDRVPVAMKNPAYFKPFELLSSLLPLPRYGSFDPTIFLGIFFPLFFGMILGDIGYGALLLVIALLLIYLSSSSKMIDAGKILGVAAVYTVIFGALYGEFFGEAGNELLGLRPILFDRRHAVMPMLVFALAVGAIHICLGLVLGMVGALRRRERKEAVYKLFSLLLVLTALLAALSFVLPEAATVRRPLLLALGVFLPVILFSGGVLAPLELLKNFGNIISYARIMAVGLTSVLLAYVANRLGGLVENLLLGLLVAGLLHAFNLLLGIFSPTVHSLRLHYVEFFSKFLEPGGRRFEPMEKNRH